MIKSYFICIFILISIQSGAQEFLKSTSSFPLSFKQMQVRFNDWALNKNLKKEKHWKYFKRWEMDMQLHSNSKGEPVNPSIYINELLKAGNQRNNASNSKYASDGWYPVGPNDLPANQTGYMENGLGRINCIAFHPSDPSTYYVGVAQGGVWKTSNNGQSWTPLTDNLPITRISDISIDPNNPNIMYISVCDFEYIGFGLQLNGRKRNTHYGLGVYKTIDGGNTWQPTGLSFQQTDGDASLIRKIIISQSNSNKLVACGVSGMYTSADAGVSWTKKMDTLFWDLQQDPINQNTLYAASGWVMNSNIGHASIYKSTDFGNTWTELNTGIPSTGAVQRIRLAIAPSDNNYIYAIAVNTDSGLHGIYKSTDAGTSWQFINPGVNILDAYEGSGSGGQGTYDLGFQVNKTNKNLVYVGGVNLWGSIDGCLSFNPISHWTLQYGPTLHGDIHFIEQQPLTGNYFVCSDGGLYRAQSMVISNWVDANSGVPWPTLWTNLNDGLAITSFYRISSSKNVKGRLLAGAQDNASFYYNGTSWSTVNGGDGMDNYLDTIDDNALIASSQYGYFALSTDDGFSFFGINPNVNSEVAEWTSPIVADYNNYGTLYAGFANVTKSTDGGNTWSSISNFPSGFNNSEVSAIAVSNTNSNVIYAAKRVRYEYSIPGSVFRTNDGGNTWVNITAGLPDSLYYTGIEVSETNSNTAFVCMAQFSAGNKVFKTTDGGSSWQNISYNLPNIPVNCIKHIPGTSGSLMIASDLGVFILEKDSNTWVNKSLGLPNVIVSDIEFNRALNKVYVCTFGRGVWAGDLDQFISGPPPPLPSTQNLTEKKAILELFPTINNGSFSINLSNHQDQNEEFYIEIIDIAGKLVYSKKLSGTAPVYREHFNLVSGMYYAKISSKTTKAVKPFVVQ